MVRAREATVKPQLAAEADPFAHAALTDVTRDMEDAIALARTGALAAAAVGHAATCRFPHDVTLLHKAGVIEQLLGRTDRALGYFHRALAALPGFAFSELEIGSLHAQRGERHEALRWLRLAADKPETAILGATRAANVARELARPAEALDILRRAWADAPDHPELVGAYAQLLIYHGHREDAAAAYAGIVRRADAPDESHVAFLYLLTELGRYEDALAHIAALPPHPGADLAAHAALLAAHARMATGHDRPALLAELHRRETSPDWHTPHAVISCLQQAIASRRPFSLVRFGDGEARFLTAMDPALNPWLTPGQAHTVGDSIWRNWFATPLREADSAALATLHAATLDAIRSADILGIPTEARLRRDGLHFGYLATLERQLEELGATPRFGFTDAWVAALIHLETPFYRALLEGLDSLSVISPHPGLAARLARFLAIGEAREYLVPGETRLPDSARTATRPHFPDVYQDILASIDVPRPGAVVLVAAGLLGKIYCARIKQLGGIAIDIGSVADAWTGYDTRPGEYQDLASWALPG